MPDHLTMPVLSDGEILLRAFTAGDVPLVLEASADPLIPLITTVPTEADPELALAFVTRQHSRAETGAGYSFAIADAGTGIAVGQVGLWLRDADQGRASVGYWIAASHRGRGLAGRAVHLVSAWALQLPGVHRLELYVEPWNEASWRVAERAGFHREGLLRSWQEVGGRRRDMYLYARVGADG